jgi:DNA-binding PadR family transcriptional regulator
MSDINYAKYLPLSEATYYVLVALGEPSHGYAIMQRVAAISEGKVSIGPGTLYGAFATLEKQGLIVKISEQERRKSYALTENGRLVLVEQIRRLEIMVRAGHAFQKSLPNGTAA